MVFVKQLQQSVIIYIYYKLKQNTKNNSKIYKK